MSFEEVSWHFVNKKKTPRSPFKSEFRCMGGLINRFLPVWCPISHSIWPLLFPHQLSGGCGTRLSIRRQDPNTYSDTEMRALSTRRPFGPYYNSALVVIEWNGALYAVLSLTSSHSPVSSKLYCSQMTSSFTMRIIHMTVIFEEKNM